MDKILYVIGGAFNAFAHIFIWSKLIEKPIEWKNYKTYIYFMLLLSSMYFTYFYIIDEIRIVLITFIFMGFNYLFFKDTIKKNIITPLFSQIIMLIAEIAFSIIVLGVFRVDMKVASEKYFTSLISNVVISSLAIGIVFVPVVKKVYSKILNFLEKIGVRMIIGLSLVSIVTINIIFSVTYNKISGANLIIINAVMTIIYTLIIYNSLKETYNRKNLETKYETTLSSLKEYEEILNKYRVSNHENKNQLLIIRNMTIKKEKDIPEYIDKLIDNKIKDDEKLMFEVNIIPAGGLRAVVYSKMLLMKEKKIECNLNIDKKLRTVELIQIGNSILLDVCKIIGVYLDNAIEAVLELEERYVDIEMYMESDSELVISISNNFSGFVDCDKLDKEGYTTKSDGHGYGLSLVKGLVQNNHQLSKQTKIENDVFIQILKIKM